MHTTSRLALCFLKRCDHSFYIIFVWILGIFLGLHIIPIFAPVDRHAVSIYVPIHRSLLLLSAVSFLPLTLTQYVIRRRKAFLMFLLCFVIAMLFGYALYIIRIRFASGAWLALFLFLFPNLVNNTVLLWHWFRAGECSRKSLRTSTTIGIGILLLSICFDYYILTPFLSKIY